MLGARRKESQTRTGAARPASARNRKRQAGSRGGHHPCHPPPIGKRTTWGFIEHLATNFLPAGQATITTTNRRRAPSLARLHSPDAKSPCLLLLFLLVRISQEAKGGRDAASTKAGTCFARRAEIKATKLFCTTES